MAFDVFLFSDKIIRIPVSYYAIANHWDLRFSPSFFSFMIFYNLSLCLCPVKRKVCFCCKLLITLDKVFYEHFLKKLFARVLLVMTGFIQFKILLCSVFLLRCRRMHCFLSRLWCQCSMFEHSWALQLQMQSCLFWKRKNLQRSVRRW